MANRFQVSSVDRDKTKDGSPTETGITLPLDTPRVVVSTPGGKDSGAEGESVSSCRDLRERSIGERSGCDGELPPGRQSPPTRSLAAVLAVDESTDVRRVQVGDLHARTQHDAR